MSERCFGNIFYCVFMYLNLVSAQTDTNIITKLEGVLKTNISSVAFNWTSENAVDGNIGPDPEQCLCCSGTTYSTTSWWTVDLGKMYPLKQVDIYSRESEDKFEQLQGFLLLLRNSTEQTYQLFYDDSTRTSTNTSVFDINLSNVLARYLKIQRSGILTICEVEIFEGDCMIGTFGEECSQQCHCADNRICDRLTGQCSAPVCKIGWIGPACDKECEADAFGEDCREKCFCAGNTTCTIDYGLCPDNCRRGYFGIHCNKVCPDGAFGTDCNGKCFCDGNVTCTKDDGICPGTCVAGYKGLHCNTLVDEKGDKKNLTMIIGVSASGGVVIFVILLSVYFCRRRFQNGKIPFKHLRKVKAESNGRASSRRKIKANKEIDKEQIEIKVVDTQPMESNADMNGKTEGKIRLVDSSNNEDTTLTDSYSTSNGSNAVSLDTIKGVIDAEKGKETSEEIETIVDSHDEDIEINSQKAVTTDISKSDSTFEAETTSDEIRFSSALESSDTIYQYYETKIKEQKKRMLKRTNGAEESELEEDNFYEPVGESVEKSFEMEERNKVLGKLWGERKEVIKSGALKSIKPAKRQLLETKFEIITSEASYLKSINVLIDVFMKAEMFQYKSSTGSMVNQQTHELIFSNILEIRATSERFLKELESSWKSDIYLSDVCKIVADHAVCSFKCYVTYCGTQHVQSRTIREMRRNSKDFDKALTQIEEMEACQSMDILSFLLMPMQRITRLRLLTDLVYKKTINMKGNNNDKRKEANRAHKNISKVNKMCNKEALKKQGEDDMKRAANEIKFPDEGIKIISIDEKSRFLVREEDVTIIVTGKGGKAQLEVLHLYIFNDIAVLTKKMKKKGSKSLYTVIDHCKLITMKAERISDIKDEKYKKILSCEIPKGHTFLLRLIILKNHKEKSDEWILSCKDETDRDKWMEIIAPVADDEDDQRIYTDLDSPLVQCIIQYTAQNDEEMSLDESDEVRVMEKLKRTGMYYGERLKDLEEGWFPKDHIIEVEDEHVKLRHHLERYLMKHCANE